ncbi:universal stress protein [Pseudomonadota bacterium]
MKTILLPYYGHEGTAAAFGTAVQLAKRYSGYVEGLFVRQLPPIIAGEGITLPGDYVTQLTEESQKLSERAQQEFRDQVDKQALTFVETPCVDVNATAGWHEAEGLESQVVGEYGRLFDLIVVGRNVDQTQTDWKFTCESALIDSGRPVIIASDVVPEHIGRKVLIIWNGSTETARTIALGMEFLKDAELVEVVTIEGATVAGPTGDQVVDYLARQGIPASARIVRAEGRSDGECALEEVTASGADLVLKGAFTHSRLRALIFGSVTSHILNHAKVPILMAH